QVGPGILASLRRQGLPLNIMAASIVFLGVGITITLSYLAGIDMSVAVGLFSGGTTNTPALGAAQQALKDLPGVTGNTPSMPGLGYAIAYPFGIIGIILVMGLIRFFYKITPSVEATSFSKELASTTPKLSTMNLVVENPNLDGLPINKIPGLDESGVIISRVFNGQAIQIATPDTVVKRGDVVLVVGPKDELEKIQLIVGTRSDMDLRSLPSTLTTRRVVVTRKEVLGKTVDELQLPARFGVTITRISRAGVEFTPTQDFGFQFGDTVLVVGDKESIKKAADVLGNSPKQLNHPQVVPIFVGIALGIIIGSWPLNIPHVPAPVRLGLAGGPLLAAIILSRIGRIGPLIWYMPLSANFMLREVGIVLFLACVGISSGDRFVETLTQGNGFYWMACASLITFLPLAIVGFIARAVYKLNFVSVCGVLSGSMTDPPALAFANSMAGSDAPSISYATVYPLTMLLRVVSAQLLVLIFI
ncbi:MAG: putative transporter, partial [Verrucomicrobia bacterium]|nr:putative transporter [Verrucomicrobiota bacterium]